mmetsp:Transcript_45660/g.117993  ORF Transcript_45660/g.117993 Transcript_45660/m.117993 type:complete len:297 (-) Transcript_45660:612-1502(-)
MRACRRSYYQSEGSRTGKNSLSYTMPSLEGCQRPANTETVGAGALQERARKNDGEGRKTTKECNSSFEDNTESSQLVPETTSSDVWNPFAAQVEEGRQYDVLQSTTGSTTSLLSGSYDEDYSQTWFQEAVLSWRGKASLPTESSDPKNFLQGSLNEQAESALFQQAVEEWRKTSKSSTAAKSSEAQTTGSKRISSVGKQLAKFVTSLSSDNEADKKRREIQEIKRMMKTRRENVMLDGENSKEPQNEANTPAVNRSYKQFLTTMDVSFEQKRSNRLDEIARLKQSLSSAGEANAVN